MFIPNRKHTIEHLKELVDEVHEFHPILNVLFRKMPGVERVHYNQGPHEMGADFILYRRDEALKRVTAIGVVVKIGSIRQNTTEVERQIKECFIPRKAVDGVETQIREVWIVSSQDITKNARDVISKEYSDKKVEFIPAQDLAGLIDEYAPDSFITTSPALQSFAEELALSLDAEDRRSLVIPGLESFYVEPSITRRDLDGYGNAKASRPVKGLPELLKEMLKSQLTILQAGAGGGKSRIAREIARIALASEQFAGGKLIPAIEHARAFALNPSEALTAIAKSARDKAHADSVVLAFVDGFDELDMDDDVRHGFIEELLLTANAENVRLVLLSRPFDEASVLRGRMHSLDIFQIQPLRGRKAVEFLARVSGQIEIKSKLISDLHDSLLFRALEGAPIAYLLLGRLLAENQQDLPSNLTELFQKYTEIVLGRWEMAKGLRSQQEYEVIVEALIWVSTLMLDNEVSEVSRSDIEDWINEYCNDRGISISPGALVDKMCERNSVLYLRNDNGVVGFRHRAFCEFFFARSLDRRTSLELKGDVFSPYWVNSYYFLAGIKRDCPDLLESMLALEVDDEPSKIMKAMNFGNLLLAGYLTPVRVSKHAVKKIAKDFADIYVRACDPKSGSMLTNMSVIQLLCVFTTSFRAQYGYKHFRLAVEDAIFELDSEERSEGSAIAMFFLHTAYREAGGALKFDDLIEGFGDSLPLVVKLGIGHETDRMKQVSDRTKKMERNLRRTFVANKGSRVFLDKLYKAPIKTLEKKLV